jgi:hypothetical protein
MDCALKIAIEETFEDVKLLIWDTVNSFHRRNGGDLEELLSDAYFIFILSYWDHDQKKSSFSTWLTNRLKWGLAGFRRKELRDRVRELTVLKELYGSIYQSERKISSQIS